MFSYSQLKKPFLSLAPMEEVTDSVFRQMVAKWAKPDLFYTEFTSVDGIYSKGRESVIKRLQFTEIEKPLIAQIWGTKVENYYKIGQLLFEMGFDGIDINMGCPVRKVVKNNCCSALIKNKPLASEIIKATQEGAFGLPVSVKTRIGFSNVETESWISFLLEHNLDLITVHGRTTAQESKTTNDWNEINKARELRDRIAPKTLIVGNGDIQSYAEAHEKADMYKLDGIMVGRGIFHNPFVFSPFKHINQLSKDEKIEMLLEHARLYVQTWGENRNFNALKRFFKIYINGFEGALETREKLMETTNLGEVEYVFGK